MIDALELTRWTRAYLPSDAGVLLTSPDGAGEVSIRIRWGRSPLRRLCDVIGSLVDQEGLDTVHATSAIRRSTTSAGEYVTWVPLRANLGSRTFHWVVGIVVADEEYTLIEGISPEPTVAAIIESFLAQITMGTSADRVRMFPYRPPAGWFGVRRALATCWLPPTFPRDPATIVVCDAVPCAAPAQRMQELFWGMEVPATATVERVEMDRQILRGQLRRWESHRALYAAVKLEDSQFQYALQLHHGLDEHMGVLTEMLTSVEALPHPSAAEPQRRDDVFTWML